MIKVLFFAQLREQLQCEQTRIEADAGMNAADVREQLVAANPPWQAALANEQLLVAVNQTLVKWDAPVQDGDEVAVFPPVTGG